MKRVLQNRLHKGASLDVDHADFALGRFQHDRSAAGCAIGIIHRAQQARFEIEECNDLFLVPNMIAACDNRNSGPQKINCDFSCYSPTAGGVLAVHNDEIQCVLLFQLGQTGDDGIAPRLTDDIT